jgi:hypothetical protein
MVRSLENMRSVTIDGRTFHYETYESNDSEWGSSYWTDFYEGYEEVEKTVWCGHLFAWFKFKKVKVMVPKFAFVLHGMDANNPNITKEEWKKKISREIELLNRSEELRRGELI